jgi:sigma-B regulation protein RsbU (phosphoserine phosphatase)
MNNQDLLYPNITFGYNILITILPLPAGSLFQAGNMSEINTQKLTRAPDEDSLELLADLSQEFATSLDIEVTLNNAMIRIMDYLEAEAASIFLLDNNDTELVCRSCAGPVKITGIRLKADQGIVGKAVRTNKVQMVRDVSSDPDFTGFVDEQTGFSTRSILCAPLSVKDKRLGSIELINKKSEDGLFDVNDQHLLSALASSASLAINNASMAAALVEQERIQKELELAREIQSNLLPQDAAPDFPVRGLNIPAREVSGDFYDYFQLPDGRIYFNLADVSGKGMNAAMLMAKTSSLFHCIGKTVFEPGRLLSIINNELVENTTRGMFVTMIGGIYDPTTGLVVLANAGHQPPLCMLNDGSFTEVPGESPPVGILPDIDYPQSEINIAGGTMCLYTDGLSELETDAGEQLDVAGIKAILTELNDVPLSQQPEIFINKAFERTGKAHDDVTLLLVNGSVEVMPEQRLVNESAEIKREHMIELRFPAKPDRLKLLRRVIRDAAIGAGCTEKKADKVVIAVNEACMNIIQHAYKGAQDGDIILEIINNTSGLAFILTDHSDPVDVTTIKPRNLDDIRPGGLGTHFINEVMDEVQYTVLEGQKGNRLIMKVSHD